MTLKFIDQHQQAVNQPDFRDRVMAGAFAAMIVAYGATPLADPVKQGQRMKLVNALVLNPAYGIDTMCWLCVTQSALTTVADLTDSFIQTTLTSNFDDVAQQLFLP